LTYLNFLWNFKHKKILFSWIFTLPLSVGDKILKKITCWFFFKYFWSGNCFGQFRKVTWALFWSFFGNSLSLWARRNTLLCYFLVIFGFKRSFFGSAKKELGNSLTRKKLLFAFCFLFENTKQKSLWVKVFMTFSL